MTAAGAAAHGLPITTSFDLPGARVIDNRGACFGLVVRQGRGKVGNGPLDLA